MIEVRVKLKVKPGEDERVTRTGRVGEEFRMEREKVGVKFMGNGIGNEMGGANEGKRGERKRGRLGKEIGEMLKKREGKARGGDGIRGNGEMKLLRNDEGIKRKRED
jgi:hypothetical protein